MVRRRLYRGIRGSIGVDLYKFQTSTTSGVPQPLFGVSVQGPSTALTLASAFESVVHAGTNVVNYFQNFNNPWNSATASAIQASGRYQMMTLSPVTASYNLAGGIRASDGGVDNPMVSGTTYNGIVVSSCLMAAHILQPSGTYLQLGGNGTMHVSLAVDVPYTIASNTHVATASFTPSSNYTAAYSYDFSGILNGSYDSVIQSYATNAAGMNFMLRFAHEMNGNWYPWAIRSDAWGFTASQYISLWNHFRSVWRAQETSLSVAHIPWIWCPNISNNKGGTPASAGALSVGSSDGSSFPIYAPSSPGSAGTGSSFYPGDSNCEFVGYDAYSNPGALNGPNPSFGSLIDNDLTWMQTAITTTRKIIICETGVDASLASSARAAWFSGMFNTLHSHAVVGVCYFNNTGSGNYPLNTDPIASQGMLNALKTWTEQYP